MPMPRWWDACMTRISSGCVRHAFFLVKAREEIPRPFQEECAIVGGLYIWYCPIDEAGA